MNEVIVVFTVERAASSTIECADVNENGDLGEPDQNVLTWAECFISFESILQFFIAKELGSEAIFSESFLHKLRMKWMDMMSSQLSIKSFFQKNEIY